MATVSAFDAKTRFGELLDRVASGEEIVITRHDKPVARMVPEGRRSLEEVRRAVAGLRELQQKITAHSTGKPKLTWDDFKLFVQEGRQ
jgi:prevent-host-death family protein